MTRERRLGRGLEALLGQLPSRVAPAPGAQPQPPVGGPYGTGTDEPYGQSPLLPSQPAPALTGVPVAPSAYPSADCMPDQPPATVPLSLVGSTPPSGQAVVGVHEIDSNPSQPRQDFDDEEMQSLCESIACHGLLQPVVVRRVGDRYQLIAGERRLRAAIQAGWTEVPANIVEADDREVAELTIVENLHRKDLNPLEKAASFQQYLEQFGGTQEELATRLSLDRSTIANLIRLLELPEPVQEAIRQGRVTQGHARALLPLGEEREQIEFCQRIEREGLSVRQTEALVQEMIDAADAEPLSVIGRDGTKRRSGRGQSEHLAALEQELRAALGLKVSLTHNARGRGKLVVHFRNHEEFERLRRHLCEPDGPAAQVHVG